MEEELNLREELSEIAALLDSEKYPETAVRVMSLLGEEELPGAYEIVESLRRCDVREELPRFLGDFYIALYTAAIREGNADAMNDLGAMYYEGRGKSKSDEKPLKELMVDRDCTFAYDVDAVRKNLLNDCRPDIPAMVRVLDKLREAGE